MAKHFTDEIKNKYQAEDFTANIGALLGGPEDFDTKEQYDKAVKTGLAFLQDLYSIAEKYL